MKKIKYHKIRNIYNYYKKYIKINHEFLNIKDIFYFFSKNFNDIEELDIIGPLEMNSNFYILKIHKIFTNYHPIVKLHIRHIFLKNSTMQNDVEIYNKLLQIYNYIKSHKFSFENAVKNFSEDFISSFNEGDLGWYSKEQLIHIFNNPLFVEGEISKPIKSSIGWHLIQVIEKKIFYEINESIKNYFSQILLNQKFFEIINHYQKIQENNMVYIKILEKKL